VFVVSVSENLSRPAHRILTLDGVPPQMSAVELALKRDGPRGIYLGLGGWQAEQHWHRPNKAWWDNGRLKLVIGPELVGQLHAGMIGLALRGENSVTQAETAFFWEDAASGEQEPDASQVALQIDAGTPAMDAAERPSSPGDAPPADVLFGDSEPGHAPLVIVRSKTLHPAGTPAMPHAGRAESPDGGASRLRRIVGLAALILAVGIPGSAIRFNTPALREPAEQPIPASTPAGTPAPPAAQVADTPPQPVPPQVSAESAAPPVPATVDPGPPPTVVDPGTPPTVVDPDAQRLFQQGYQALRNGRMSAADAFLRQATEVDGNGTIAMMIAKGLFDPVLQNAFQSQATVDPLRALTFYEIAGSQGKAAEAELRLVELKFWATAEAPRNTAAQRVLKRLQ
jgi:hypothetical protein